MAKITSTIKMTDQASKTIKNINTGFTQMQSKIIALNQGIDLASKIWQGAKAVMSFSDNLTTTKARLDLINDGLQTQGQLQNMIFQAANNSRSSYSDMAQNVSKLGMLAKDAFSSTGEIVAFNEVLNKAFTVSGSGQQEISSAMYQLTQAMSSGALQGDELRTIREAAPMLYDSIAKYMGKSKGELKELGAEGKITSDIIKNAMFAASEDIDAKFKAMPITFEQAGTKIKNSFTVSLQGMSDKINGILNSEKFQKLVNGICSAIQYLGAVVSMVVGTIINILSTAVEFIKNNQPLVIGLLSGIAIYMAVNLVSAANAASMALWKQAAAWMAANWQMVLIAGVFGIIIGAMWAMKVPLEILIGVVGLLVAALAIWKIVQWAVNGALYACPIVWIIVLIIALIAAVFAFMQWMAKATGLANSGLGMIAGGVMVVIGFFKNLGLAVANIALGIWEALNACAYNIYAVFNNVIKGVQSFFWGLLSTVMDVIDGIVKALNKLPFIDIDTSGIEGKAKEYADKKAKAEDEKLDYKNIGDAFDKGFNTFEAFKDGWVEDEFNKGKAWGDAAQSKIENALGSFNPDNLLGSINDTAGYDIGNYLNNDGTMPTTIEADKSNKEVNISDEDLKLLKDIATKDYMLNYKHITPNVNIEFGDIKETADVNQVKDAIESMMRNELGELYLVEEG